MKLKAFLITLPLFLVACEDPKTDPETYETIPWDRALAIIASGRIDTVYQSHDRSVFLELKDGTGYLTRSPALDDVVFALGECGAPCADVGIILE